MKLMNQRFLAAEYQAIAFNACTVPLSITAG